MVNIKIDNDEPSRGEVADWLNNVATKIREGFTTGLNWDLDDGEVDEDLIDS